MDDSLLQFLTLVGDSLLQFLTLVDDSLLRFLTFVCAAISAIAVVCKCVNTKRRHQRLKRDYFVGVRWQRDLFDNIVNRSLTEDMLYHIVEIYDPTKNWIEKDLLEFYSLYMISRFYINRRDMIEKYYLERGWRVTFEKEFTEKISKIINKICFELDYILNYYILPEIFILRFKTPSIDNIEMATAKAKEQQLEDLIEMKKALTNIRQHGAKLLKEVRVIDYEPSNSVSILGREKLYVLSDAITRGVFKLVSILRLRREKTHIYSRIENSLLHVQREIGVLEWKRIRREIDYLDDKILYYKGLNDAYSNEYAVKLRKKRDNLDRIIPDLEYIGVVLVKQSISKAHDLRGKYSNRLKDRYLVKQPILRFNLRLEKNEDDED